MGTSIQNLNLSASDFGGDHLDGCNEYLNIVNPTYIKDIHRSFIDVGANIIETNTFGATPIVLDEYKLSDLAEEINFKAAKIANAFDFIILKSPRAVVVVLWILNVALSGVLVIVDVSK